VYRRQRLKPTTRCGHQASATTQLPRVPLPEQPVGSKLELLNMSTLTPKECIAKYPNAGGGGGGLYMCKRARCRLC
jgi:hypothetical protein